MIGVTLGVGWLSSEWLRPYGPPTAGQVLGLHVVAAGTLFAATLGVLGWEIQTWKGQTLPEKVNSWLFRALYVLGTYLFVLSVAWS